MLRTTIAMLIFVPVISFAQNVDIKDVSAGSSEGDTTTIEIHKNKKKESSTTSSSSDGNSKWEVSDGTADVAGESGATGRDAKANWTKACKDWAKDFREEHKDPKESKVLSTNCGKETCGGDAGNKTCSSTATYKMKVKIN